MFVLVKFSDSVRIAPADFRKKLSDAVIDELNKKYANKVVKRVGLCISLFELHSVGDPLVVPADGCTHVKVTFTYIVFRPFVGQILSGRIKKCTPEGVFVTLGFFEDILIPADQLQENTVLCVPRCVLAPALCDHLPLFFPRAHGGPMPCSNIDTSHVTWVLAGSDHEEQVWVWNYFDNKLYMDVENRIRFRIVEHVYFEQFKKPTAATPGAFPAEEQADTSEAAPTQPPFSLIAAANQDGLGLEKWWQ
ncbi:hypothetical protein H696_00399 [Fonticula alba]|uniref:DNA-directed RNA polymerase III subunit RPC8 n=1 Tax=Fonticula alba TaxID=691883 RepID=A0A058ZFU0_FONAL|nr:hypothetical protein H696_00399 [Fonticula alba]KCV72821.1 hypothetical protein H696_00399 [Fonticula alba]|eukprot:XP_009492522.1 hypothetical protein H696_00399 [Fonticula alba]